MDARKYEVGNNETVQKKNDNKEKILSREKRKKTCEKAPLKG